MDKKFKYGIQFEVLKSNNQSSRLCFHIATKNFAGITPLYFHNELPDERLQKLADVFRGFPSSIRDHREIEFIRYDHYEQIGVNIKFRLFCTKDIQDSGQVAVETQLHFQQRLPESSTLMEEGMKILIYVYPSQIDEFVADIDKFLNIDVFAREQIPYLFEKVTFTLEAMRKRTDFIYESMCE